MFQMVLFLGLKNSPPVYCVCKSDLVVDNAVRNLYIWQPLLCLFIILICFPRACIYGELLWFILFRVFQKIDNEFIFKIMTVVLCIWHAFIGNDWRINYLQIECYLSIKSLKHYKSGAQICQNLSSTLFIFLIFHV